MKIIESFSNKNGEILRLVEYDKFFERLKNGGHFAIECVSLSRTTKRMYDYYYNASKQFYLEEHRAYIAAVYDYLIKIKKVDYYKEYSSCKDIIYFLRYCCDFKEIVHPETLGINQVEVIDFIKSAHIEKTDLEMTGEFKEYAKEDKSIGFDLIIEKNPFDNRVISRIIINAKINSIQKRIFYLENTPNYKDGISNTTEFMYCYAAYMHYNI